MGYNDKQIQIIEISEALFASRGFDGTSVRDIAQAVNMNLAMVSYYFGSKDKLLVAIFEYRTARINDSLRKLDKQIAGSSLIKLNALIDHYIDQLFNNKSFYKLILLKQLKQVEDTELQETIFLCNKKYYDLITKLITEGQELKEFQKEIDISLLVSTLTGTSSQIIINQLFYRKEHGLESMQKDKFELLLKRKVKLHLKAIFKQILISEEKSLN